MTKGADGTTRVISQPITATPKASDSSKPLKEGPQKVQILRAPDGKISVRGLLQGQQLIQMPDGKLHIVMAGQQGVTGQLVAASSPKPNESPSTESAKSGEERKPTHRITSQSIQQVQLISSGRQMVVASPQQPVSASQQQQVVMPPPQQVVVQAGARATLAPRMQTLLVQGQLVQRQQAPAAVATVAAAPRPRPVTSTQQIVVNNPALVQQIAAGKIQLATVNGQQVLIRPTGNNQAQIVAHIGQSPGGVGLSVVTAPSPVPAPRSPALPAPAVVTPPPPPPTPPPPLTQQEVELTEDELVEKRLLVGQPPGTVIKTVTAQVNVLKALRVRIQCVWGVASLFLIEEAYAQQ